MNSDGLNLLGYAAKGSSVDSLGGEGIGSSRLGREPKGGNLLWQVLDLSELWRFSEKTFGVDWRNVCFQFFRADTLEPKTSFDIR